MTKGRTLGVHEREYRKNKAIIMRTQNVCGICGRAMDFELKAPHPMSPTVDHIIPVNKGGHPSAIENLQLAHWYCNRQKSDKVVALRDAKPKSLGNRNLPQSRNWASWRSSGG